MLLKILEFFNRKRVILDRFGREYMHRYYLGFKEKINWNDTVKPYPNIFLHKLCLSDEDRDVHDHPWNYVTVILKGGYYEITPILKDGIQIGENKVWKGPGSIIWRKANDFHRLEMENPSWTLFMHGWRKRDWGFLTQKGFVNHSDYIKAKTSS